MELDQYRALWYTIFVIIKIRFDTIICNELSVRQVACEPVIHGITNEWTDNHNKTKQNISVHMPW